jgi:hypothetical protein
VHPVLDLVRHGHDIAKPVVRKVHDRHGPDVVRHEGLQVAGFARMKPATIMNLMTSASVVDLI